jgi:hypothetical protein
MSCLFENNQRHYPAIVGYDGCAWRVIVKIADRRNTGGNELWRSSWPHGRSTFNSRSTRYEPQCFLWQVRGRYLVVLLLCVDTASPACSY